LRGSFSERECALAESPFDTYCETNFKARPLGRFLRPVAYQDLRGDNPPGLARRVEEVIQQGGLQHE